MAPSRRYPRTGLVTAGLAMLCVLLPFAWSPAGAEDHPAPPVEARQIPSLPEQAGQIAVPRLAQQSEPLDLAGTALDITWKLLLVLVLAYGVLALLRRYSLGLPFVQRHTTLQILESVPLGPNRALYVVRAGSTRLLLGATPGQISALGQWDNEVLLPAVESLTIPLADVLPPSIPPTN